MLSQLPTCLFREINSYVFPRVVCSSCTPQNEIEKMRLCEYIPKEYTDKCLDCLIDAQSLELSEEVDAFLETFPSNTVPITYSKAFHYDTHKYIHIDPDLFRKMIMTRLPIYFERLPRYHICCNGKGVMINLSRYNDYYEVSDDEEYEYAD